MKKISVSEMTQVGLMAALVYTASAFLQISIPTAVGSTRLHMGNVLCLLSGMLLGPLQGGFAAGIGSMFFDLTNPAYITSAPFTFAFKFVMAWLCGKIVSGNGGQRKWRYVLGSAAGAFVYVLLYLLKNFIEYTLLLKLPAEAVMLTIAQKAAVSCTNAVTACLVAVPLGLALGPVVEKVRHL
ncbi:MAG: ECF transporter S component [Lachnospiraceae bacterium]|nr:ECF transporter S component [Lachnospiraceae bacterium]